jgi:hypothetical protein
MNPNQLVFTTVKVPFLAREPEFFVPFRAVPFRYRDRDRAEILS